MAEPDASTSSALVRKRTDTELMPPPPPAKRIQRPKTVLDEDSYTDGLSKIIARDFFPGLIETETQNEYLNALDSKDPVWISSAGKRLKEAMTPGRRHRSRLQTPSLRGTTSLDGRPGETPQSYAGDTPASVISVSTTASTDTSATANKAKTGPDTNVSLGAYQSKYTSEDNESFYKLLDKQNQTRAEKHAWLYNGNKLPSKMQLKQKEIEDRLIASGGSLVDNSHKKDLLAIKDQEDRPAAPETWKTKAKNGLMFLPDGVEGSVETVAQKTQAESLAAPKSIVYANTRLPGQSLLAEQQRQERQLKGRRSSSSSVLSGSIAPSPTLSAVRDAIAGKPRRVDADSTAGSLAGSAMGGETPRVNGYAFVDDEEPEHEPELEAPPIINFGKADGTPNPFQLQDKSKREGLHYRMVERIAQSKRTSARVGMTGRASQTPHTPIPHSPRLSGGLTPAGQRLWSNMAGGGGGGGTSSKGKDAILAFNKSKGGQQNNAKGSRRARLREIRSVLQ